MTQQCQRFRVLIGAPSSQSISHGHSLSRLLRADTEIFREYLCSPRCSLLRSAQDRQAPGETQMRPVTTVVESVIPPGNEPFGGKFLDLVMLLIPGGKERTEDEYRTLFDKAGFELTQVVPTSGEVSIVEGMKK